MILRSMVRAKSLCMILLKFKKILVFKKLKNAQTDSLTLHALCTTLVVPILIPPLKWLRRYMATVLFTSESSVYILFLSS